ncbi:MAG TPA: hypothetical protein VIN40_03640 [Candidatus Tyrphobacter sp.]
MQRFVADMECGGEVRATAGGGGPMPETHWASTAYELAYWTGGDGVADAGAEVAERAMSVAPATNDTAAITAIRDGRRSITKPSDCHFSRGIPLWPVTA